MYVYICMYAYMYVYICKEFCVGGLKRKTVLYLSYRTNYT